jgi:hypothetical protein
MESVVLAMTGFTFSSPKLPAGGQSLVANFLTVFPFKIHLFP